MSNYSIGNMLVKYRNKTNMIFLCLLVRRKLIKAYDPTYHKLFEPLLVDLHDLRTGINVNILIHTTFIFLVIVSV